MGLPTVTSRPEKTVDAVLSRWNAANLPLIYDITNTKWPVNSEDGTTAITSITDDNGFAKINRAGNDGEAAKEWTLIDGTTNYDGPQQIRSIDGNNFTIDVPFVDDDTGTTQIYYQNYTTLIRVFAGLAPNHDHQALKPITLIGTIEQRPDTDNITLADVRDYIKNQLNTDYDKQLASWPNDINAFCDFYISWAERYDVVTAGVVGDFTSAFTLDLEDGNVIFLKAVHSALQFGYAFGGNMGEYVVNNAFYSDLAKWMTFFERSKIIDYNNFDLSIIIDTEDTYGSFPLLELNEYDQNGDLILLTEQLINDDFYGVYRLPINLEFNEDTAYVTAQLMIDNIESSELHTVDIDIECFDAGVGDASDLEAIVYAGVTELTWTDNSEATVEFTIQQSTDGVIYNDIDTVGAGVESYSHNDPTNEDSFYRIKSGIPVNFSNVVTIYSWIEFSTNWDDAGGADGAYNLDQPAVGTVQWRIEQEITFDSNDLNIDADSGILDGTTKGIVLYSEDDSLKNSSGNLGISWGTKKFQGEMNLTGYQGTSFDDFDFTTNPGINSFVIPVGSSMLGQIRFTACTGIPSLDFSNIPITQGDNNLSFSGMTALATLLFKGSGNTKTGDQFFMDGTAVVSLDLSGFDSFTCTQPFDLSDNSLLTSFTPPATWSLEHDVEIKANDFATLDVSGLSVSTDSGAFEIESNASMTGMTFGATTWNKPNDFMDIVSNGLTGTLDTSACVLTFSSFEIKSNGSLTSFSFHASSKTDRLRANDNLLGYVDITGIMNDWDNVTSLNLDDNAMSAAEVNCYLVDFDGQVTAGVYTITIAGSNAAPDGASGGCDGSSAKTSLIGKGLTVTTS